MGVAQGIGTAISGTAASIGQVRSTVLANEANRDIAEQNNKTSIQIARENNALQLQSMRESNEFSRKMALDMFDLENAYNRPLEQVKRYQEAGLNPAIMMEGAGAVASGNGDISTPSASPSGISPSMPSLTTPHMEAVPSLATGFIDALNSIAQLKLANAEVENKQAQTNEINTLLDAKFKDLTASAESKAAQALYTNTMNDLEKLYGADKRVAEIKKLVQDATLAQLQGETEKAEKLYKKAQTRLANSQNNQVKESAPFIIANLIEQNKLIKEQQSTEKSKQAAGYASAEESRAAAAQKREQTRITAAEARIIESTEDDIVYGRRLQNAKDFQELGEMAASWVYRFEELRNRKLISDEQVKEAKEAVERAKKENTWFWWSKAIDTVERINNGANKWAPWALSRDDVPPQQGMLYQSWQSNSTR